MKLAWKTGLLVCLSLALQAAFAFAQGESQMTSPADETRPQLFTGPRLLKLGEGLDFELHAPEGGLRGPLVVFTRYLEQADPGEAFTLDGSLDWVEAQPKVEVPIQWSGEMGKATYTPPATGSYLAKWTVGEETFWRYFAAVDDEYVVLSFGPFAPLEPNPTFHGTGIPLDYRLPAGQFNPDDPVCRGLLAYNRLMGDNLVIALPDTPDLSAEARLTLYDDLLSRGRAMIPDPNDGRSARLEHHHPLDPGYIQALSALGVCDHGGLWEANCGPWLGMPEFPYFSSPVDCRKTCQTGSVGVISHQWDFCGGWHFLGPLSWHYKAAEGDWALTEPCLEQGVAEFANLAQMSGHPAFVNPLYEALDVGEGYPNADFQVGVGEARNFAGQVDDAFLCDRALSEEELAAVMISGLASLPGLLAAWDFETTQDQAIPDLSSAGHNARLLGSAQLALGRGGQVLSLDGEAASVLVEESLPPSGADFSFGCWANPAGTQRPWANLFSSHNSGGGGAFRGFSFEQASEQTNRFYFIAGLVDHWYVSPSVQLVTGKWQHLAAVREGRRLSLYLDGQLASQNELPSVAPFPQATEGLRIGDWVRGTPDTARAKQFLDFVERYQRFFAFEATKQHKVAFARSQDVGDYFNRHYTTTPRTIFDSMTNHVQYDMWWLCTWASVNLLVTRDRLPWLTRLSALPKTDPKDPLSTEYLLVEDSRWSIRFERECPHPIWRFDYRVQEKTDQGSRVLRTELPDVYTPVPKWERDGEELVLRLRLTSPAPFKDYALCVWALPAELDTSTLTCAGTKELVLANNTDGERHVVLFFDLKPSMTLELRGKAL